MSMNSPADRSDADTLVLGIGNVLWADEGFGVRAVEALNAGYRFPESVRVMDGGTQGLFLLPYVQAAHKLLVFDAIDFGLPEGTMRLIRDGEVPRYMGAKKVSMHQTGFQEVLASAALLDELPERLVLIGVQPETLDDYGASLCPAIKARIPEALALALGVLNEWGVSWQRRQCPSLGSDHTGPEALALDRYENG
jgi:hydrogenase maturation protease